jgi:proteasome activator subunit 4
MQEKCKGLPTIHISNYIHHLLLNLTHTYPIDSAMYEPSVLERGLDVEDWGSTTAPSDLTIKWHRPNQEEIAFATEIFESQVETASRRLLSLMSDTENPSISRKGKNKEWSDEVSRNLGQLRLVISGIATLFDPRIASGEASSSHPNGARRSGASIGGGGHVDGDGDIDMDDNASHLQGHGGASDTNGGALGGDALMEEDDDPLAEAADDEELKRQIRYPAGYFLDTMPAYARIHELREDVGRLLSTTHRFLTDHQEDDVACFTALYATYRTWITDVGIERSAHPLERLIRLYRADIAPFKISGRRKVYPRPLLIKRADAYQLQRIKYNASYRTKSELDKRLLLDLAESCVSSYADVRRVAQGSQDSSLKALIGGRPLVIPVLLQRFRKALDENDHDRIKGAMYTLLFTPLIRTLIKDWRFAPDMMRMYIQTANVDKTSIQQLGQTALFPLLDFGRPLEKMVIVDRDVVDMIKPEDDGASHSGKLIGASGTFEHSKSGYEAMIETRHRFIEQRRAKVEAKKAAMGLELIEHAKGSHTHWKVAARSTIFAANLCLRFQTIAPPEFIDLVASGTIDPHPELRGNYQAAFSSLFTAVDLRAMYEHDYRKYLTEEETDPNKVDIVVPQDDDTWTERFLAQFDPSNSGESLDGAGHSESYDNPAYFVDTDFPGWLVWGKKITGFRSKPAPFTAYDDLESDIRERIGKVLTKDWFAKLFEYLKQEPRDTNADRFRMQHVVMMMHTFELMNYDKTVAKFEDLVDLVKEVYGDGSDKHQHRATAEILGAMLSGTADEPREYRDRSWNFAAPMMLKIIADDLTPDNLSYWMTCLHIIIDAKDPRRSKELMEALSAFRLDMNSNAAFKESAKVQLIEFLVNDAGWHFRNDKPILDDFLTHIDHPYKSVRESIGRIIATIYRTRYHESFSNVTTLLKANKEASSIGIRPYQPTKEFAATIHEVFARLEKWRHERTPGQQTPSSYTSGSKTVLTWLDSMLSSQECTQLIPFFPDPFIDQLLHMMDVKEDPELMKLAYHVYRHLPNIPYRNGEEAPFIDALIRIGKGASSWHQRLRALVNMQVIYFRRLFLTPAAQRKQLFDAVGDMLSDVQLEVRDCASATLAGMIRCSPSKIRNPVIATLKARFAKQLRDNPMPKRSPAGSGVDTPVESQKQILRRHAAVLGLGALIEAFPYATPPPSWMPEVLALLATKTANDRGVVGRATKGILAEFKKTRTDSWGVDQKVCPSDLILLALAFWSWSL